MVKPKNMLRKKLCRDMSRAAMQFLSIIALCALGIDPATDARFVKRGGSVLDAVDALREAGAEVLGVVSIFTYGMKKGVERMIEAKVKSVSLTNLDTIARVGAEEHYITEADVARLLAFRDDPADESWIKKGGTN